MHLPSPYTLTSIPILTGYPSLCTEPQGWNQCQERYGGLAGGVVTHGAPEPLSILSLPLYITSCPGSPTPLGPLGALLHDHNRGTGWHTAQAGGLAPGWEGGDPSLPRHPQPPTA